MRKDIIHKFPRQSVWAIIGLSLVTLTIYFPFWLRKHTRIINQLLPNNQVPSWWFPLYLCITILNFALVIPEIITEDHPAVMAVSKLISMIDIILTIVWIFKLRNRMNILLETEKKTPYWYQAFWTLLFGLFYLQYKVNKLQELKD